jgi:DNA-binding transcriptional ArsR family regulator
MIRPCVASPDLLLFAMRYAPLLFIVAGVLVVWWLARLRFPHEIQPLVLAALSETEALPVRTLRERLDVDLATLERALDELRMAGLVVRWFEPGGAAVYRKISSVS